MPKLYDFIEEEKEKVAKGAGSKYRTTNPVALAEMLAMGIPATKLAKIPGVTQKIITQAKKIFSAKPAASTVSKSATRLSKAEKAAQAAKGKPSAIKPVSPSTLQTMSPAQRKAVQALQRANAKPLTRNQAGRAQAQARRASKPKMTTQQRKATAALNASRSAPKAPPSRPKITTQPPKRSTKPISRKQAAGIGAATTAIVGAGLLGNKGQKKSQAAIPTPKPRPKTKEGGPGRKFAKPSTTKPSTSAKDYRPSKGGQVMPKKFQGSYNSDKQKLTNITVNGKKSTYVIPKGMTSKQAKSLLTGTAKKYDGGRPGFKAKPKKMPMPKTKPESKKTPPSKYKGFSKLPESVQKRISPNLASKYKSGGSVGSGKVARQVKGWGAARKPKK